METIKKSSLAIVLSLFALFDITSSIASSTPDISGTYQCTGYDPNITINAHYTGKILINKNGDVYNIKRMGNDSFFPVELGTAIFNKDINNVFSFVFWNIKSTGTFANELMIIKPDGSLDGIYLDSIGTKTGTETCSKSK